MTVPVSCLHTALRSADRRSSSYVTVKTAVVTCRLDLQQLGRLRQHRLKHWLQFAGDPGDNVQDFAGSGLLLERFGQVAGTCLHLLEKARVFNSDYGLVREGVDEFDLVFGERAHFGAPN